LLVSVEPAARPERPAALALASIRRNETSPGARVKSLSYLDNVMARLQAQDRGADEALMLNSRGEIAGGAAANLFWLADGRLYTPALDCGVLDGIARGQVIAAAPGLGLAVVETRAQLAELEGAQAVFLTNSLIGVRPVHQIGGRPVGHRAEISILAAVLEAAG
jgi:branched-chain amino acid aminotransferase/4-amino-4-deoxychorismate lyase